MKHQPRLAQSVERRDGGPGGQRSRAHVTEVDGKVQGEVEAVAPSTVPPVDTPKAGGSSPSPRIQWPRVSFGETLGQAGSPYLKRWVVDVGTFSVRVHHWMGSDDTRHPHDHGWDFVSVLVRGDMIDRTPGSTGGYIEGDRASWSDTCRQRWIPEFFMAEHRHSVVVGAGGAWTVMLAGPTRREWGFWTPKRGGKERGRVRFRRRNKYFREHGHH